MQQGPRKLDFFLRKTWLNCCGHISEFNINAKKYSNDKSSRERLHQIFNIDHEFKYDYSLGSTAQLKDKIISTRVGKLPKKICLLARNNLPAVFKLYNL